MCVHAYAPCFTTHTSTCTCTCVYVYTMLHCSHICTHTYIHTQPADRCDSSNSMHTSVVVHRLRPISHVQMDIPLTPQYSSHKIGTYQVISLDSIAQGPYGEVLTNMELGHTHMCARDATIYCNIFCHNTIQYS